MITMPIVYGLWKLLSSTNVWRLSQHVYAGGVECSVADSQSFARKLNREGVKLYGWQPALSGLLWKAAHDLRGAEILNGVWRRERFSHAADNGENAKMQGSTL